VGTRYGRMAAQMANFWDQTGSLWMKGALIGKIGAAFTSTGTQHGGQETTLVGMLASLMHHGMVVAGLPYSFEGQMRVDEVTGGTPYGASTVTGTDGARQPSVTELNGARFLGRHVANISKRLAARA
jgi:NAD(P)H dehydrogenase (quinone)